MQHKQMKAWMGRDNMAGLNDYILNLGMYEQDWESNRWKYSFKQIILWRLKVKLWELPKIVRYGVKHNTSDGYGLFINDAQILSAQGKDVLVTGIEDYFNLGY